MNSKNVNVSMLNKVYKILSEHKGKNNAVSSSKIAKILGINEDSTHAITRSLITKAIELYKLPVAATKTGYYTIQSRDELDEYISNLNSRIDAIKSRLEVVKNNFVSI